MQALLSGIRNTYIGFHIGSHVRIFSSDPGRMSMGQLSELYSVQCKL